MRQDERRLQESTAEQTTDKTILQLCIGAEETSEVRRRIMAESRPPWALRKPECTLSQLFPLDGRNGRRSQKALLFIAAVRLSTRSASG